MADIQGKLKGNSRNSPIISAFFHKTYCLLVDGRTIIKWAVHSVNVHSVKNEGRLISRTLAQNFRGQPILKC